DVEAAVSGFRTSVRKGISVTVGASVPVNFELAVGEVQQRVEVEAAAPLVDTTNAAMGGLVGENAVRELPLNGRDWLQLVTLQPGVIGGVGQQSSAGFSNSRAARGNGQSLSISGARPTGNVFLVDGLVVNDYSNASPGSGLNVNLGVDAIREFRVLTSEYTAEYGRSTGGVVTAVYKSGSNQFHGGVFEFLRNDALDARNFFDAQKPPFRRNQFGGSAGGPIIRNKTFIFGDYEELREVKGLAHNSFTLSPNARNGVVCANSACSQTTVIPISPLIKPYLAFFPQANGPITGDIAQFNFAGKRVGFEHYGVVRVDHSFTSKTSLSGSYQADDTTEGQPDPYNQKLTGSPSRHNNAVMTLQHVFSPGLLNTARFGMSRTHATDALDVTAIDPIVNDAALGFIKGRPAGIITVGGGVTGTQGGIGASGSDTLNYTAFQWGDELMWVKGRHTFGFGGTVQRLRYNKDSLSIPLGEFDFDTVSTFLQAIPGQFTGDVPGTEDIRAIRQTYLGFYVDDAIALRPNLKVTVGLRYEHVNPLTEQFGRTSNLATLASPTPVVGGPYFNTTTKNFAPRVAVAWDPTGSGKTSIRTGFGIYDLLPFAYLMENRTNGFPVFLQGSISPPPPSSFPTGAIGLVAVGAKRETYVEQNPPRAYNMQWNFTVQRQLVSNLALTVGYVGSRGNHLPRSIEDADQVPLSLVTIAPDGHLQFPKTGTIQRINPVYSRIAATVWDDSSTYHSLVTNLEKRFSRGFFFSAGYSWSKSIDLGSNTFSDNEATNTSGSPYAFQPRLQRGVSDFDVTHNFVLNYSYAIPTSSSFTGLRRAALGGWELGGIFTARSGAPFSVTVQTDRARTGDSRTRSTSGGQRPDYSAAPGCNPNAINPGNPNNYINIQCFAYPALGTLGNLGRNTLRGPGMQEDDFSLFKNWFLFGERVKLQFRAEAFNLLNKANFQGPKVKVFDGAGNPIPNAGLLTSPTQTSEREIQFGLKLNW
ncbi:MAG TPA: TonB-dependent receptor, partial [Bryobacteraceae bacterium]|nr:TonB-dependent receptor [Bryobacteraceae bacterium]